RFIAERGIPAAAFQPRFLNCATDNPWFAGFNPEPLIAETDLLIALDCDVPWVPSVQEPPISARIVHIGLDPAYVRYPMRAFRGDLAISGDAASVIEMLENALGHPRPHTRKPPGGIAPNAGPKDTISPEYLSRCISDAIDSDTIVVNEYPLRLEQCPRTKPGTYFGLSAAGGLGWGLPAALGAKLAAPDRLVVATLGDGAYIFANPTACHWAGEAHNLPVLTIVFNNSLYGAVRNSTKAMYGNGTASVDHWRMLAELDPSPQFEKLIEASGGRGFRAEDPSELPGILAEAVATVRGGRQALVNVICPY
ncbi:MAG TPA: thiamine pyrophosphate-dependent enzyme, partial [Afipia sp.]